jgi:hypothetical protein
MTKQGQQGTGKHGHKDTEEPYPHHETAKRQGRGETKHSQGSHTRQGSDDDPSLARRECTDDKGEVHHHTKTYMDQHGNKK